MLLNTLQWTGQPQWIIWPEMLIMLWFNSPALAIECFLHLHRPSIIPRHIPLAHSFPYPRPDLVLAPSDIAFSSQRFHKRPLSLNKLWSNLWAIAILSVHSGCRDRAHLCIWQIRQVSTRGCHGKNLPETYTKIFFPCLMCLGYQKREAFVWVWNM